MDLKQFFLDSTFIILIVCIVQTIVASEIYDDDEDESGSWNRCPWIRNKLKNGRVKIRSRGRIAKFLCEPGYELAGKRFATCVRGQWNNPLPVCVSRGCHRPPHVENARVTLMYRGAVLTYDCLPGYTLDGGASIYCDGRRWSADPPSCVVSTSDPQTSCDFEDPELCGWSHDPTHEFDWKRNQFSTPSGHVGTGPSFDHTFGEGKGGFYLFMEASSPRSVNDSARLFSPVYPSDYSGGCFVFWYHMFGSTTGGLRVYVKPESHVFGELPPAWTLYGDQGNRWFRGNISLPHISENFQIIIEGIRGSSYIGDTAIDDVSLNDVDCENIGNATDNTSETFSDSCRGRCRESTNSSACGCNDDCVPSRTCCYDFESICTKSTETEPDETKKDKTSEGSTMTTTISAQETEPPEVTKVVTVSVSENKSTSLIFKPTQLYTEKTTTAISIDTSTESTTTSPEQPISPRASSSASTSTTATTTTMSTTTSSTTTTSTPSTTTQIPTTSTPSTTTQIPTTSTPSTTTQIPTTTTPSTTTVPSSTTVATTPSVSTSITTSSPTTMYTTAPTVSPTVSTTSTKTPIFILPSVPSSSTSASTVSPWFTSPTQTSSTRKTYNLRPRNRTTVQFASPVTTPIPVITPIHETKSSEGVTDITYSTTTSFPKSSPSTITTRSTTTAKPTTARPQIVTITGLPKVTAVPQESTKRFTVPQETGTEKSKINSEAHASKTVSSAGAPVVTIVSIIIVLFICAIIGALVFVRKWRAQKLSKLEDDSEMKFLSENEVVEYSDSSALDRINFNP